MENMETHHENDNILGYNINDYLSSSGNNGIVRLLPTSEKIPIIFDHLLQVGTANDINDFFTTFAEHTSLEFVRYMVNNGANPRHWGYSAFMEACKNCNYERIVYFINECNIDVNVSGSYALVEVMSNIYFNMDDSESDYIDNNLCIDCLKFLLDSGCVITDACIKECIRYDRSIEPMRLLIQYGVDINRICIIFCKYRVKRTRWLKNIIYLNNFNCDFKQAFDKINV